MRQRYAILVFLVVVVILCAGAYAIGRLVLPAGQAEFRPRPVWTPPGATPAGQAGVTPTIRGSATPGSPGRTATPTSRATIPPARSTVEPTALPAQTSSPTPTATATESPTPEATAAAFAFELARPVRHSSGDCPGSYILGRITDARGGPLANVRLKLSDEYGNQQTQISKAAASEVGRYDFPLFGAPRRFYLSVVDAQGRPLSPEIEIPHGVGVASQATCHWADWQQR
jgi:hypothetical protein